MTKLLSIELNKNRIYGLDILRAFAILFVVLEHGINYLPVKYHSFSRLMAFDGVTIFFVLSGYLIGGILIKILEREKATFKTLLNFWIRRWFRTLPNYYFILFLILIVLPFIFTGNIKNPLSEIDYFLFIQNFYTPHSSFFPVAWSLSVEEWFYLLIPSLIFIFIAFFKIKPKQSILIIAVSVIILITFIRHYRYSHLPFNSCNDCDWDNILFMNFSKQVITRLDSLMFGVIGAFFLLYYKEKWTRYKVHLLIIGLLILFIQKYTDFFPHLGGLVYIYVFSFSLISLGTLLLIPFLSEYKTGSGLLYKSFTYISLISYSMYLLHPVVKSYPVEYFTSDIAGIPIRFIVYWVLSIIGSILLYKYFEKPVMDMREKIK